MRTLQVVTYSAFVTYILLISIMDLPARTLGALFAVGILPDMTLTALASLAGQPQFASAVRNLHHHFAVLRMVLAAACFPAAIWAKIDVKLRPEAPLLATIAAAFVAVAVASGLGRGLHFGAGAPFLNSSDPSDASSQASDVQKRDLASTAQDLLTAETQSDVLDIVGLGVGRLFPEASVALVAYHHWDTKRRSSWTDMYDKLNRGAALNTLRVLFPFERTLRGAIPESIRSAVEYGDLLDSDDLGPDRYDDWPGLLETYGCSRIVMVPMGGFKGLRPRRACAVLVLLCGSSKAERASSPFDPSRFDAASERWDSASGQHHHRGELKKSNTISTFSSVSSPVGSSGLDTDLLQEFARVAGAAFYRFDLQFKVQMHHAALVDFMPELQSRSMDLPGSGGGFGGLTAGSGTNELQQSPRAASPQSPALPPPRGSGTNGRFSDETNITDGIDADETAHHSPETSLLSAPIRARLRTGLDEPNHSTSRFSSRAGQAHAHGKDGDDRLERDSSGTGHVTPKSLRTMGGINLHTWDTHDHVTMLFCDLVGYTSLAEKTSDLRILHILHAMYSGFDDLMERISEDKMMKLDVVGDAYIACGGLNWQKSVSRRESARTVLRFASEIVSRVAEFPLIPVGDAEGEDDSVKVQIRIGVATGSVAAGLIGRIRKKYTCLGTTVNLAARLESNGRPMCVHVAEETAMVAGLNTSLLERQTLKVKGIAEPVTAYLWDPILLPGLIEQGVMSSFRIPAASLRSNLDPAAALAAAAGGGPGRQLGPHPFYNRRRNLTGPAGRSGGPGQAWPRPPLSRPLSSAGVMEEESSDEAPLVQPTPRSESNLRPKRLSVVLPDTLPLA